MLNRQDIENGLYDIFNEVNIVETDESDNFILSKEIDSIQLISIIVEIEVKFNIEIPDEYLVADFLSDFEHVADVVEDIINRSNVSFCEKTDCD